MRQRGFTLIEVLVLLAIIAVLVIAVMVNRPKRAVGAEFEDARIPAFVGTFTSPPPGGPWTGAGVNISSGTGIVISIPPISDDGTVSKFMNVNYLRALRLDGAVREIMETLTFAFNSYEVERQWNPGLDRATTLLIHNPEIELTLEGHTDLVGGNVYNLILGYSRAKAVRLALIARGIAPDRLKVTTYGERNPIEPTSERSRPNRRVVVIPYATTIPYPHYQD